MSVKVIFSVDFSRQLRHRGNFFTLYHLSHEVSGQEIKKKVLSAATGKTN